MLLLIHLRLKPVPAVDRHPKRRRFTRIEFRYRYSAEMENSLPERLIGVEGYTWTARWDSQNGGRVEDCVAGEIWKVFDLTSAAGDVSESVEEVPEGSSVCNRMIYSASDEDTVL
ncbi:unnamed protein product [Thlaspi arvense]|uniref:Uncharacterized protein n=1 Tax=Thlaspi arvense TaxID=13288 RepID=A0AAU9SWT3_THLAR|nr:unnamed protein product [Thlaspi arvense]